MTIRQIYEAILIELNKENAPNILLEEFNYLANKAVNLYINKRYNVYDINQQTTDDLRVLKATALLTPVKCLDYGEQDEIGRMMGATYEVSMPTDYLHLLNCICIYDVTKTYKCYNKGDIWRRSATRLTADIYSQILDNFWLRPTYKRPYYYIHNVNQNETVPTNPYTEFVLPTNIDAKLKDSEGNIIGGYEIVYTGDANFLKNGKYTITTTIYKSDGSSETSTRTAYLLAKGTDFKTVSDKMKINTTDDEADLGTDRDGNKIVTGTGVPSFIKIGEENVSNVERGAYIRYGNQSTVRMEIRYGTDDSLFALKKVYVDYIKAPLNIRLTQEQLDLTEDTSQMMEFPDYVCQEIINELVHIIMENIKEERLQTHPVVSQSIAAQQLAPEQQ